MKLVRFGNRVINFDNVCDITIGKETVQIYFNVAVGYHDGGEGKTEQEHTQLVGADVIAFEHWLEDNSYDARASMTTEEDV